VWRWHGPNAQADSEHVASRLDGGDFATNGLARASWSPLTSDPLDTIVRDRAPSDASRTKRGRAQLRPAVYALAAGALMAGAALVAIGDAGPQLAVERELVTFDSEAPRTQNQRARPSGDPNRAEMRIVGWLIPNTLHRLPSTTDPWIPCRHGFQLSPLTTASNAVLRVEYPHCGLPDAMVGSAGCVKITADGYLEEDGHVEASRVLAEEVHCQP
jgi:hypothetical protein